jgi:hypothetical protein
MGERPRALKFVFFLWVVLNGVFKIFSRACVSDDTIWGLTRPYHWYTTLCVCVCVCVWHNRINELSYGPLSTFIWITLFAAILINTFIMCSLSGDPYKYNVLPPLPAQRNLTPPPTLYPQQPVSVSETYSLPRFSRTGSQEISSNARSKRSDINVWLSLLHIWS